MKTFFLNFSILLILVLTFKPLVFKAQKLPFAIGPKFGLTYSHLPKYTDDKPNDKIGINAGLKFDYYVKDNFSVGGEVLFNQRASNYQYVEKTNFLTLLQNSFMGFGLNQFIPDSILKLTGNFINDTVYSKYKANVRLNYIDIPIAATFHFSGVFFTAGVTPCFLVGSKASETFDQDVPLLDVTKKYIDSLGFAANFIYNITPAYKKDIITTNTNLSAPKKFDLNCFAEFGLETTYGLQMSTRFTYGLIKTAMHQKMQAKNQMAFMFNVGYLFGAKNKSKLNGKYNLNEIENTNK